MSLLGKTILITGGARRLGKAAALACAEQGADLILHYNKSMDEAETTANLIDKIGVKCQLIQAELSDPADVDELFAKAISISPIFGLINNASLFKPLKLMDSTIDDWDEHFRVNLTAPFQLIQKFARYYKLKEPGRVINMLDWRALRPGKDHFPYTISKAGLAALTKASALSLSPHICVNAIALGAILPPEEEYDNEQILKPVPMKRWADITEFTRTILFLLDGPAYITGEIIHLDGGRHLV